MHIAILYGYGLQGSRSAEDAMDMALGLLAEGHDVTFLCHETQQDALLEIDDLLVSDADWGLEGHMRHGCGARLCLQGVHVPILPISSARQISTAAMRVGEFTQEQRDRYVGLMVARLERVHAARPVERVLIHHMSLLVEVGARFRARVGCSLHVIAHGTALRHSAVTVPELRARLDASLPYVEFVHARHARVFETFRAAFPSHAQKLRAISGRLPCFQAGWFRGRLDTPSLPSYVPPAAIPSI